MDQTLTTIGEAKTHLSKLIHQVEAGTEVIVKRGSKPVAKIVPYVEAQTPKPFPFGKYAKDFKGVELDMFLEPLTDEEMGGYYTKLDTEEL